MTTGPQMVERARLLAAKFTGRAAAAEQARRLPAESVREMMDAGLARILMPKSFGGYDLDFDTWNEVVLEISAADAAHGWCASLFVHHAHLLSQFPEAAQKAAWANGPDVPIAASFAPRAKAVKVDGGYRLSGQSAFASGVDNSTWVMVGALLHGGGAPEWVFLMVPPGQYTLLDTWHTTGMCGTGSNTIVTDNVFVPNGLMLSLTDMRAGKGPGVAMHKSLHFRALFYFYAPLTFASPMLGAAQGAYAHFREWVKTRQSVDGKFVAQKQSTQVTMARVAADLDAADLLLRRTTLAHHGPEADWPMLMARSVRDFVRVSELTVSAIDTLIGLCGAAGFASSHPIQRAWRDIHFAATHIALNVETGYTYFGRTDLGLPYNSSSPFISA